MIEYTICCILHRSTSITKDFPNPLLSPRNIVKKRILLLMLNIFKNSSSKRQDSSTIYAEMENHDASKEVSLVNRCLL